jgi:hypothetical protein
MGEFACMAADSDRAGVAGPLGRRPSYAKM